MRPARSPRALQYCHERAMRLLEEGPGLHEVAFMLKVGWRSVRGWRPAPGGCLWPRVRREALAERYAFRSRPWVGAPSRRRRTAPSWLHS